MMNSLLSHSIRKLNRFELKYILPIREVEGIKHDLRAYLLPDEYGDQRGRYSLASLYYDSPDLRCYFEKENGIRFRRKLRIRHYENGELLTDSTPVYLEIKQRVDRVTQKRRLSLPYNQALLLCNDRQLPEGTFTPADQAVLEEILVFLVQYNLQPMSIIRYQRQALIGTEYDLGLRVTFDTLLSYQVHNLHLHQGSSSLPMLQPHLAVMEIKVNERIPTWLTELIAAHNLIGTRVSKYCCSIEASRSDTLSRWRFPAAESSSEILSSSYAIFSPPRQRIKSNRPYHYSKEK
jgi:hypothetical protein